MIAFLFTFGLAALLVVGGMMVSLRLRAPGMPAERHLSGLRRSYAAPMDYITTENSKDEMSRYVRKVFVILILILVMLSVIIINAISSVVH